MSKFEEYKEIKKYQLAVRLTILITIVSVALAVAHIEDSIANTLVFTASGLACIFLLAFVLVTKKYKPIYYIICSLGVLLPTIGLFFLDEVAHYTDFVWMMDGVIIAFLGIGNRFGIAIAILSIFSGILFITTHANFQIITTLELTPLKKIASSIEIAASLGLGTYVLVLIVDFYARSEKELQLYNNLLEEQNTQIKHQGDEKTVLIKEIHHRVKNNLQIVTSLLRMQSHELSNEESKKHFGEAINRILAMSLVHEKLYQKDTLASINLSDYINDLSTDLLKIYSKEHLIKLDIKCDIDSAGLKSIVPLGLIINELLSNSLEHAFDNNDSGKISMKLTNIDNLQHFNFNYSDSGSWKQSRKPNDKPGFGVELIEMLTDQLEGSKECITSDKGTAYTFSLKNLD
ncbi:MAG: two-component sensor histidine kinase [Parvicella sp.]